MEMVFRGELVLVDWQSLLDSYVAAALSHSNGEKMAHIPEKALFENYTSLAKTSFSFAFHPLSGW